MKAMWIAVLCMVVCIGCVTTTSTDGVVTKRIDVEAIVALAPMIDKAQGAVSEAMTAVREWNEMQGQIEQAEWEREFQRRQMELQLRMETLNTIIATVKELKPEQAPVVEAANE